MWKIILSLAFVFALVVWPPGAQGHHVKVGEPVKAFLYCETPYSAEKSLKLLLAVKAGQPKTFQPYHAYILSSKVPCFDTRSVGVPFLKSVPLEKLSEYVVVTDKAVFTLWKVDLNGTTFYTWEGDKVTEA